MALAYGHIFFDFIDKSAQIKGVHMSALLCFELFWANTAPLFVGASKSSGFAKA